MNREKFMGIILMVAVVGIFLHSYGSGTSVAPGSIESACSYYVGEECQKWNNDNTDIVSPIDSEVTLSSRKAETGLLEPLLFPEHTTLGFFDPILDPIFGGGDDDEDSGSDDGGSSDDGTDSGSDDTTDDTDSGSDETDNTDDTDSDTDTGGTDDSTDDTDSDSGDGGGGSSCSWWNPFCSDDGGDDEDDGPELVRTYYKCGGEKVSNAVIPSEEGVVGYTEKIEVEEWDGKEDEETVVKTINSFDIEDGEKPKVCIEPTDDSAKFVSAYPEVRVSYLIGKIGLIP